ncbi:hypothetical protein [Kineococcus sp. SYSU DK001]|uniref:hypothetical protein n=1 Tax=Kineococcus sp. SYSU DK001 TaxID=3383122 RepID=UPI003D7E70D5
MDLDSRPARALDRFADTVLVGLLTVVAALPLVTAWTAVAAATGVLGDRGRDGTAARRYLPAFRARLRAGVPLQLLLTAAAAVAVVDVTWATAAPLDTVRTVVLAAGTTLGLAAGAVGVTALTAPARTPLPVLLLRSGTSAAAHPLRVLGVLLVTGGLAAAVLVVPLLLPVAAGLTARVAHALLAPAAAGPAAAFLRPDPLPR